MRTTLTLDPDVAALLRRALRERKAGLKQVVNEALRSGLQLFSQAPKKRARFRVKPVDAGACSLRNLDNIGEVLAIAEGEMHK